MDKNLEKEKSIAKAAEFQTKEEPTKSRLDKKDLKEIRQGLRAYISSPSNKQEHPLIIVKSKGEKTSLKR